MFAPLFSTVILSGLWDWNHGLRGSAGSSSLVLTQCIASGRYQNTFLQLVMVDEIMSQAMNKTWVGSSPHVV